MIEMQSGFRGFLLTGQKSFLQPFYEGMKSVPTLLKEQRTLINTHAQVTKLDSIEALHFRWLDYANSLITTRLDTFPEASARYRELFETKLKMEVGKKMNDRIQKIFLSFDNDEYQIRQVRRKVLQQSITNTRNISLLLTVISIVLALLSSLYFIRTITGRIGKMVTLADKISKGEFRTIDDVKRDELNKLAVSLNSMSQTLEKNFNELTKKNKELDQFAYVVSHDLKAPLRGIANVISWIEEDHGEEISEAVRNDLQRIKGRTNRLENMINGLLEYARIGKIKKGTELVDLQSMVSEIAELIVPKSFSFRIESALPSIRTERIHIEQVFTNLISNAVKYNKKEKGSIVISARQLEKHYEFSVTDDGPGIEQEYFDKIFIIFQTLQERDAFESTGVGLAIVKKIIEDHKGTISVSSSVGKGSTFTFTWPLVPSQDIQG
jgi:signal transduction histidine kinase